MRRTPVLALATAIAFAVVPLGASAQGLPPGQKWATSWAASVHGPYPVGNPSAQPVLRFALPPANAGPPANAEPSTETGARDQTFRLIVAPDIFGPQVRLRFSNAFGTRPVTLDGVFVGLQLASAALVGGSNQPVRFAGQASVTIPPGQSTWSDAVALPFVHGDAREMAQLAGRKIAVSFHVAGESGPMTWHAKALQTSYLGAPGAGAAGAEEGEAAFPFSTTSWYFLDAVDMSVSADTAVIVAFGDSITDGTASTLNGDDRWPNVLARRLHAVHGNAVAVVNAGIGGNQIVGPAEYSAHKPYAGGPSAGARLERDVLDLSGVSTVIWLEGINDFSRNGNATVETVTARMREIVGRMRARLPGVRIIGATVTSALGSSSAAHGFAEQDDKRKALNEFIRTSGLFDGVADFDQATRDSATGGLRPEFVPESTTGQAGDKLHPNRAGYLAIGNAIDLDLVMPRRAAGAAR